MTVFLAERRERSSKDGMSYGSPIDFEGQKIKKTGALHFRVRIIFFRFIVSLRIMDGSIR